MATINRLIIFGDSLSDIGIKRASTLGSVASLLGHFTGGTYGMRTNQVLRYSDRRNWTDFLWEWSGGASLIRTNKETSNALSAKHLSWNRDCRDGHASLYYANYGEGGAMGGSDRFAIGLGTFADQVQRYLADLASFKPPAGDALYLIWFGLNDLVTNERDPATMKDVANEMVKLCLSVRAKDPSSHFLIGNMPNPQSVARYAGRRDDADVTKLQTGSFEFGHQLATEHKKLPSSAVVDIYTKMAHVNDHLSAYGLKPGAQPHGVDVRYDLGSFTHQDMAYTSDGAHPTEKVYGLIAQIWATEIMKAHRLGSLDQKADVATFKVR